MSEIELPDRGFIFWPVGNGDSTTVVADRGLNIVIQVDLNHTIVSEGEEDPRAPVVEHLVDLLDKVDDRPYLAVFALTHPDQDHCRSFAALLEDVTIGEIWLTPRSFIDAEEGTLSEDATAFYAEAKRRIRLACETGDSLDAGDRVRIVGYSSILEEELFDGFPETLLTIPGEEIPTIDGNTELAEIVEVFVHSPFKSDTDEADRNSSSLGLHITLLSDLGTHRALLLGDLKHDTIESIFEQSIDAGNTERLQWDLLLAPHHCSRHAVKDTSGDSSVDAQSLSYFSEYASNDAQVVASCSEFRSQDADGDDPPHLEARVAYESIVSAERFISTTEYGEANDGDPIVFEVGGDTLSLVESASARKAKWRSISAVGSVEPISPGESRIRSGDSGYA